MFSMTSLLSARREHGTARMRHESSYADTVAEAWRTGRQLENDERKHRHGHARVDDLVDVVDGTSRYPQCEPTHHYSHTLNYFTHCFYYLKFERLLLYCTPEVFNLFLLSAISCGTRMG